ncbi:amino acid adenylation domain-containing protein [Calothrix sp. NIES-4071]|nr:amino acid adenylation domain-containing protein [Calothrix sp. NIES-4071]BAZ57109.1 amino acid adenylation domain-containing protein [Calothrix sp. NIES-4105]
MKIRGFRIELGEIESILAQHTSVQDTIVIAREDEPENKRLVAYVVIKQNHHTAIDELRHFLQEKLPEYMVPSAFVAIEHIPLTANGKVDRRALPIPNQTRQKSEKTFVAPDNAIEAQLTEIWQEVLGVAPIGVTDNFFNLGGHSLLAVKLFTQIEKRFAKKLPLATLFQAPTIKQLANILNQQEEASWSSLVLIQQGDSNKKPLFFIHALGGNIIGYQTLVRHLRSDQPIYGLQAQGLNGEAPHTKVEDMASYYIKQIQTIQPNGSYQLAGFSSGGIIAFEIAQQLIAQGQKIDLLFMFDTYAPKLYIDNPSLSRTISAYLQSLIKLPLQSKWNYALAKIDWLKSVLTGKPSSKFDLWNESSFSEDSNPYNMKLIEAIKQATMADYSPQPYPGKVTLFTTKEVLRWCQYKPLRGWDELTQGVDIHSIPGTHLGMLSEPNVQILAQKMMDCLEAPIPEHIVPKREESQLLIFPTNSSNYETA